MFLCGFVEFGCFVYIWLLVPSEGLVVYGVFRGLVASVFWGDLCFVLDWWVWMGCDAVLILLFGVFFVLGLCLGLLLGWI